MKKTLTYLAAAVALFLAACIPLAASAAKGEHGRAGWNDRHAYYGRGYKQVSRYGWGWDSAIGFYVGPIYGRHGKAFFRCFAPGYRWYPCPHY
jgi:hypothetical protein